MEAIEKALLHEFACYYQNDELVEHWGDPLYFSARARDSAERMLLEMSPENIPSLNTVLRGLRDDRRHPLHAQLEEATNTTWTGRRTWPVFQKLMDDMLAAIEARAAG